MTLKLLVLQLIMDLHTPVFAFPVPIRYTAPKQHPIYSACRQRQQRHETMLLPTTTRPDLFPSKACTGSTSCLRVQVWVWIARSQRVYEAPPWPSSRSPATNASSWWSLFRVRELVLHHVPYQQQTPSGRMDDHSLGSGSSGSAGGESSLSSSQRRMQRQQQRREEQRQLALLRQALKHHEWYHGSTDATCKQQLSYGWSSSLGFYHPNRVLLTVE